MPRTTVTLALQGEVSLAAFSDAVSSFSRLVHALSRDVAGHPELRWVIVELEAGSALATARGVGDVAAVESVAGAYIDVGRALERGATPPFTDAVRREALALVSILDGGVELIRFETADSEAIVRETPSLVAGEVSQATGAAMPIGAAYGGVLGRVQTLSSRGGLRFTLFDTLFDRAVSCRLEEGQEEIMRDVWGRVVVVEGLVTRDPATGRPHTVRRIRNVTVVHEASPDAYLASRGVLPRDPASPEPEVTVRALRDA